MEKQTYFSHEALARFVSAQGKTVNKIICHLWQNNIEKQGSVEIIDNLELHFTDGQKLTIACNENGDGLDAIQYDYKEAAKQIQQEFNGKIKLFAVDASGTKMWQDVTGKILESVRITKDGENHLSESVLLCFGDNERRIVSISPMDGLVIDYYED
ncbi:MAG: hypothetical protein JNL60_02490 [Bacteroidia bacterium]|nr:hypothetical protein [Bacteroidia bacterium]